MHFGTSRHGGKRLQSKAVSASEPIRTEASAAAVWVGRLITIFFFLTLCSFSYITLLAATDHYQDNRWVAPVALGLVLMTLYVLLRSRKTLPMAWKTFSHRCGERGFLAVQALSLVVMLAMAWLLRVNNSWDYGRVIDSAYQWATTGEISNLPYFIRYGNNQLVLVLHYLYDVLLLKIFPSASMEFCKAATLPINCLCIQVAIHLTYQIAKIYLGRRKALAVGILCLTCSPLYLYSTFAYTDTLGLPVATLILYSYLRFTRDKGKSKWAFLVIYGCASVVGYHLKATIGIVTVATMLDYLLHTVASMPRQWVQRCLSLLLVCVVFLSTNFVMVTTLHKSIGVTDELYDAYSFPPTHWVMMALNTSGGFNQGDVDFTASFPTLEERKAANIAQIKERLQERGIKGTISHVLYAKWRRTWAYHTLAGDDYTNRQPIQPNLLHQFFTPSGSFYSLYALYAAWWWILVLVGVTLSAWRHFKGRRRLFVPHLAIFGITLLLSFWECNSRYLVVFLPFLILASVDGLSLLCRAKPQSKGIPIDCESPDPPLQAGENASTHKNFLPITWMHYLPTIRNTLFLLQKTGCLCHLSIHFD